MLAAEYFEHWDTAVFLCFCFVVEAFNDFRALPFADVKCLIAERMPSRRVAEWQHPIWIAQKKNNLGSVPLLKGMRRCSVAHCLDG